MLVLGRTPCDDDTAGIREDRRNEIVLTVDDDVVIRLYLLKNNRGMPNRIGIKAPKDRVNIVRGELYNSPTQEGRNEEAAP